MTALVLAIKHLLKVTKLVVFFAILSLLPSAMTNLYSAGSNGSKIPILTKFKTKGIEMQII